jgi:hypothetical protein
MVALGAGVAILARLLIGCMDAAFFLVAGIAGAEITITAVFGSDPFAGSISRTVVLGAALVAIVAQRSLILWEDGAIAGLTVPPQTLALVQLDFGVVRRVALLEWAVGEVHRGEFWCDLKRCLRNSFFQLLSVWDVWKGRIRNHGQRGFWGRGTGHHHNRQSNHQTLPPHHAILPCERIVYKEGARV